MSNLKSKVVVQTANVLVEEKHKAEEYARDQGFDSLQAALRFVIHKMANGALSFNVSEQFVSPSVEDQIGKSLQELKSKDTIPYKGDLTDILNRV